VRSVPYSEHGVPMPLIFAVIILLAVLVLIAIASPLVVWSAAGALIGAFVGCIAALRGDR
jgi:membrane associated rhomboid family serine protease